MSEVKKISSCTIANRNSGEIAYVTQKITPLTRPRSSTRVRVGIKARDEGNPIPNAKPKNTISIATPLLLNAGEPISNKEEITPKRTQKRRKRILLNLSAIIGPISADTIAAE